MDIFGKKEKRLKEKIEELEKEKERLEKKLEGEREQVESLDKRWKKEKERYRAAVSGKKKVEEKNNRLNDKIESLEDKIDRLKENRTYMLERNNIKVSRVYKYLKNLGNVSFGEKNALTITRKPGKGFMNEKKSELLLHEPLAVKSLFISPLPLESSEYMSSKFAVDQILNKIDRRTLYIHLSAGGSGIGIFNNRKMVESRVIRSDVKSKHTKGGYSQKRFERIREQQIKDHFEQVWEELKDFLDRAFEQVVVSSSRKINGLEDVLGHEYVSVSSGEGHVHEEDDIKNSFESGMGFQHVRLPKEKVDEIMEKADIQD